MRLCFFIDDITHIGGIERVTSILCKQFAKNSKLEVKIVSQFRSNGSLCYDFSYTQITYLSDKDYNARPASFLRLLRMLGNVLKVRRHFNQNKYDIIVGQSFPNSFSLFLAGVRMGNVIAAEHVFYDYYGTFLKKIRLCIYRRCYKVVVLTEKDKKCYDSHLSAEKTIVIPNPMEPVERYQSPLDNNIAIAVGRLEYQKGFDTLIDVFKRVHEKHPKWEVQIYGDGNLRNELESQICKARMTGIVRLMGVATDMYAKYREASFLVMSSRFEGFGMVLVEAQSQGLPIVSFDCPNGPSDIIEDGVNGILVENQNNEGLYEGICYMIEHPVERKEMGHKALENIDRYSCEIICERWISLFQIMSRE